MRDVERVHVSSSRSISMRVASGNRLFGRKPWIFCADDVPACRMGCKSTMHTQNDGSDASLILLRLPSLRSTLVSRPHSAEARKVADEQLNLE